jgi:hypothetical protein
MGSLLDMARAPARSTRWRSPRGHTVEVDAAGSASRFGHGLASGLLVSAGVRVGAAPCHRVPSLHCDVGDGTPRRGCELMGSSSLWLARSGGPAKRRGRRVGCWHGPASWRSAEPPGLATVLAGGEVQRRAWKKNMLQRRIGTSPVSNHQR